MKPIQLYKLISDLKKIIEKDSLINSDETNILIRVTKSINEFAVDFSKAVKHYY